jgi:hypothetical protein
MAKRKNAAALFEVIHSDNRYSQRPSNGGGWSLSKLFRGRKSEGGGGAIAIDIPQTVESAPSGPSLLSRLIGLVPPMPRIGMTVDPDRQVVRFQLSYTGALVSAFTLFVVIALAYMIGRQGAPLTKPALAEQTTEELRNGPAYADVLDIGGEETDPPLAMATEPVKTGATPAATSQQNATQQQPPTVARATQGTVKNAGVRPSQWTEPKEPANLVVSDSNRTVGLQYVIVQSYPPQEKTLAESAMATLNQNGVLCTIENLAYAPGWYCVVGITGFARTKNSPEYDGYVAKIQQISDTFAGTSKFKRFEPKPLRWKDPKSKSE